MGTEVISPANVPTNQTDQTAASSSADSAARTEFAKAFSQEAQKSRDAGQTLVSTGPTAREQKTNGGSKAHGGGTRTSTVDHQIGAQYSRSAAPGKGASPAATGAKTADAPARNLILSQNATGLKPGESISAKRTEKQDITNAKAEMTFDFSKQITKDQAAAILFQGGKVPEGATLTQGKGNQWTVEYRNNIYPDVTFSWVGGAKAFNTAKEGPPRRDLKNDMGFVVSKRYRLDEGQSPEMNLRRMVQPGPGYEVVFDKPKTADQVKDTFFEKGVRNDQVRVIPVGPEPTAIWQVQMLDGMAELKTPAARALQDSSAYAKEAIAPGLPDGIKAHIQNQTVPSDAKRFAPDVYVWEQEGHIVRVKTNGKKGDAGYYNYEETKLHPTDQQGNDTMRWFMLKEGLPVRKAWQEYIKHWDQIHIGLLGMVGAAGSFMPRYMGGGGGPRSAWEEPTGFAGGTPRSKSNEGVVSGEIVSRPGGAPPHAPAQPKVIVDRSAYTVEPGQAGMSKALGLSTTRAVAHASDGHGADFDVVAPTGSPKSLPPGVTYTDAGGTGPLLYGAIAIKPSGDIHVTTGRRPGGHPSHQDLMKKQFGPLQVGEKRFGFEFGPGYTLVTRTSGSVSNTTPRGFPTLDDLPSIERALSEAGRLEGAEVHVMEGNVPIRYQWTSGGWKPLGNE